MRFELTRAKGTPAAHPPPTHPGPLRSAAVLCESESSSDDEEPDKAVTENTKPEDSTLAEDAIESLALHAPGMLPETTSEPDSGASESLAWRRSESLREAHAQLEKCFNNGTDPPAWLLDIVMTTGGTNGMSGAWRARDSMTSSARVESSGFGFSVSALSGSSSSLDDSGSRGTAALLRGPGCVGGGCAAGVPFACCLRFFFSLLFTVLRWFAVELNSSVFSLSFSLCKK